MQKIIWALYDEGNMSWYRSKYRVISIRINDHSNLDDYYRIDLRLSNENLIKQLSKLPNQILSLLRHRAKAGVSLTINKDCLEKNWKYTRLCEYYDFFFLQKNK